jgi:hypothetical protein
VPIVYPPVGATEAQMCEIERFMALRAASTKEDS